MHTTTHHDATRAPAAHDAVMPVHADSAHAGAATAPAAMRLGVLVGSRRWLVDLAEAGEIVPVPAIAPVPLTHAWFRGLANLRGALHAVTDLAAFAGDAPAALDKDARLLALGERLQFNAAILVSRMLGLRSTAGMRRRPEAGMSAGPGGPGGPAAAAASAGASGNAPAPDAAAAGTTAAARPAWQGATWIDDTGAEWHELVLHRLVRDERFLAIGR